jgi:ring-1,2-phenylacetyl-CoA epoxidase subunit PaaE
MNESKLTELIVTDIRKETPEAVSLILQPVQETLNYTSGQFLTLEFQTPFGIKKRSYSISSSTAHQEPLTITVKEVENGTFSRLLVHQTPIGSKLFTSGVGGHFTLPEQPDNRHYLMLAAGSGITPIFSIIKTLLHTTKQATILLCYSNRSKEQTIFYHALNKLEQEFGHRFTIRYFFSDNPDILERRLSTENLQKILETHLEGKQSASYCFVCGPFMYMDSAGIILRTFGVPPAHIKMEDFNPTPIEALPKPPDISARKVTIHLNKQAHTIEVQYPKSIVQSAIEAGLNVPFSCESGQCGTCIARLLKGEIWMAYNEVLTPKEMEDNLRLTCLGFPIHGDVTIEY